MNKSEKIKKYSNKNFEDINQQNKEILNKK